MPQVGVLGGSFDPPHFAHVALALAGISLGGLARVIVAPTYVHAFGKPLGPFEQRLALCRLAFADVAGVEVSAIERELGGVSRSLRLIETLAQREPGVQLRLLVGSDILAERERWQDFERIAELAPPLVAARVGHAQPGCHLGAVLPEVSSTALREALARGEQPELLPWRVRAYIRAHALYRAET
ncbi:MAG TPA: nicotinate-nicotinamide nucleotide adenylyltransferase [Polyangiales bacterium]